MNLKTIIAQIGLLPDSDIRKHINGLIYPMRNAALREAVKDEPNIAMIRTLRVLEAEAIANSNAKERIHTLDSTALFVFEAQDKSTDMSAEDMKLAKANARNEARKRVMRSVAANRTKAPKSKAELDKLIDLELQRADDLLLENFNKATEAVVMLESIHDGDVSNEDAYDEAELPEWVSEAIVNKIVDVAVDVYRDAERRLSKARFDFQKDGPLASKTGALALLDHFGVKEDAVDTMLEKARVATEELFKRLESEEVPTTIDNPPKDNTPAAKKQVFKTSKKAKDGITSADMAQAGGVKGA